MSVIVAERLEAPDIPVLRKDKTPRFVAFVATVVSIAAFVWFDHLGMILYYKDAVSHMEIARRVLDSQGHNAGQLGGVWPALPHVLMLPFVGINPLYYSGLAGSIISMAAYVTTSVLLFKIVYDLTDYRVAGLVGAAAFMFNPNVLYMQSTPMTELLLFACMAGMVYGVQRWIQTDRYQYLVGAGFATVAGCYSRYEAWILFAVMACVVAFVLWRKRVPLAKAEDHMVILLVVGGIGPIGWMLWNWAIFGNPFNFQSGSFAKPSLWVNSTDIAVGHWKTSLETYYYAVTENLWPVVSVLSVIGLAAMLIKDRLALRTLPVLASLTLFPFFVVALYKGQRPLHVTQLNGEYYNVRFGLLMILPASVLVGYLVSVVLRSRWLAWIGGVVAVAIVATSCYALADTGRIVTTKGIELATPTALAGDNVFAESYRTSLYLKKHYDGGLILSENYGNERLIFDARIAPVNVIYEGTYKLWPSPALTQPQQLGIRWIVMRYGTQPDGVFTNLHNKPVMAGYHLVYRNRDYYVYQLGAV